eukprot:scaffold7242_cov400-Prasinococcus_capsulatus_cf.AAC.25
MKLPHPDQAALCPVSCLPKRGTAGHPWAHPLRCGSQQPRSLIPLLVAPLVYTYYHYGDVWTRGLLPNSGYLAKLVVDAALPCEGRYVLFGFSAQLKGGLPSARGAVLRQRS